MVCFIAKYTQKERTITAFVFYYEGKKTRLFKNTENLHIQ